jgi:soluble lytic murein transglycosylase
MKHFSRIILGLGMTAAILSCSLFSFGSTPAPSITNTSGPTPTLTSSPVPTPTETPMPIARVGSGDKALFDGDVDTAMVEYRAALGDTTDQNIKAAALWGLARAQYEDARYPDAIATLNQLIAGYPNSPYLGPANFIKGQSFFAMKQFVGAAAAYQDYLNTRPGVLDSYVQQLRGDALSGSGNYADALTAYTSAQAAPHLDDAQALQIKIAQTHANIGDYATALTMYDTIAVNTTNDYVHAQMDYLSAEAYLALNQKDQAYERFKHSVENYPLSYYSYLGLIELVGANVKVSDLDRGLTDYFAGQYDVALASFDRFIAANPVNDGTAHYYRGLCLEELQKYQDAVNEFTYFIQNYSNNPKWSAAWDEKATIQWLDLNLYPDAAQTLLDYVKASPTSSGAPDELMSAARILERDGRFDQAGQVWQRVSNEYPDNSQASTAVFYAGIMQYRQSDYADALPLFERSLVQAVVTEDQARAYLWIGKTQDKLGSQTDKQNAWQQAQNADPGGYYSERAGDLLMGRLPFSPSPVTNLNIDLASDRKAADSWVRLTFKLPTDTDLSGLGSLATDLRVIRGRELWDLGEYEDAHSEFEDLRNSISNDAVSTYRLANYLLDLGDYFSGINAARQVLTLAGLDDQTKSMLAPLYFSHVRYGLYYSDLILPAAKQNGFDPLFLMSVVRQESLFEGFINSTAGARGLMQIVPGTGAGIAHSLGWPINYIPDQLYRPNVSIAFGAYYLSSNRNSLDGDLYAALSAYNGGLGNALDWKQLSQGDPDLFLESVRFEQTRQYIRSIYEIYTIYRRLYGSGS